MAITTQDQLIAAMTGTRKMLPISAPSGTTVAGYMYNINKAVTTNFGVLATPAAYNAGGTIPVGGTTAGYPTIANATSGKTKYISRLTMGSTIAGNMYLYDTLWACSGMSGIVTTAQTVTGFTGLTRNTTGVGNRVFIQIYTATGATAVTATVSYTNSDGTAGRTGTAALVASSPANRMYMVSLQSGDVGVRSVQSVTLSATTGTAGNFGVTIAEPLTDIPFPSAAIHDTRNYIDLGLPSLEDGTALTMCLVASTTTSGIIAGNIDIIEG